MERPCKYYPEGHGAFTPWGMADWKVIYGDGVNFYATPSHGGFRVLGKALERIPSEYQQTKYAPKGWFEENCDWTIVAYFLPELFAIHERDVALAVMKHYHPEILIATHMQNVLSNLM